MINKRTVFILGAGASAPYGFPTSDGLRKKFITEAGQRLGGLKNRDLNREGYVNVGKKLALKFKNSNVNSIDRFLNDQDEDEIIFGKILIMAFIRDCEKHSKFAEDIENPAFDWYKQFYNHLIRGIKSFDELSFKNFTIITFNYDRSFEYFLYLSIRNTYHIKKVSDEKIMNLMRALDIQHVYGKVNKMIWESEGIYDEDNTRRVYCEMPFDYHDLYTRLDNIKIISEVKHESFNYKKIIENAEEVYFLGFGFLEENMEILGAPFEKKSSMKTRYISTAFGCSAENIEYYMRKYFKFENEQNKMIDCDCCSILKNYLY